MGLEIKHSSFRDHIDKVNLTAVKRHLFVFSVHNEAIKIQLRILSSVFHIFILTNTDKISFLLSPERYHPI